jgi:alkylation response protein AidB-like acyl-CoA dehydrogenase/limonene-1,2-epoxide hydrolase
MDVDLTSEQAMMRESLSAFLADRYDFAVRQAAVASDSGWRPEIWEAFAQELGILGAAFPEELGGFGGGAVENLVIMRELGRALAAEPYLSTVVIGGGFLKHGGGELVIDRIGSIIAGDMIVAAALYEAQSRYNFLNLRTTAHPFADGYRLRGEKIMVMAGPWASHLIVSARTGGAQMAREGVSIFLIPADLPGITRRHYRTVDGTRASDIHFDDVDVPASALIGGEGAGSALLDRVLDEAAAAVCAEASGVLQVLHEQTLEYTRERKQFGQPIAKFQVPQHRMSAMLIELEQASAMAIACAVHLDDEATTRARVISAAKVRIGRACKFIGENAVQLHGAIGTTDEIAVSHYFKRAIIIEKSFGSTDSHLARFIRLSGQNGAAKSDVRIVEDFLAAFDRRDIAAIDAALAQDAVYHNMPTLPVKGRPAIAAALRGFIDRCNGISFKIHTIAASASGSVLVERTDSFVEDGKSISLHVNGVFELVNGKITAWRDYFDQDQYLQQKSGQQGL